MNLKDLKNSNILVAIYIDDLSNLITLEETFYSVSKQTCNVDLLVLHPEKFSFRIKNLVNRTEHVIALLNKKFESI
jgi:hypothetical protein